MIREFVWFVFLVLAVVGLWIWGMWLRNRVTAQAMDQEDGNLPDTCFDSRTSDSQKQT
jgi:hypothetical protein